MGSIRNHTEEDIIERAQLFAIGASLVNQVSITFGNEYKEVYEIRPNGEHILKYRYLINNHLLNYYLKSENSNMGTIDDRIKHVLNSSARSRLIGCVPRDQKSQDIMDSIPKNLPQFNKSTYAQLARMQINHKKIRRRQEKPPQVYRGLNKKQSNKSRAIFHR